jgi:NADPH2:quinone reductase
MEITNGEGVKCVVDGIGKATMDISIDSLARRGIFVSFGNASGEHSQKHHLQCIYTDFA